MEGVYIMKRTLYAYNVIMIKYAGAKIKEPKSIKNDINTILQLIIKKPVKSRRYAFTKDRKILYITDLDVNDANNTTIITFTSAKYNSMRKVVNTETLISRGILKGKLDGDEEKNHVILKFYDDNSIACLYEYNKNGASIKKIISYLNEFIRIYHKNKKDLIHYRLDYESILSSDFLKALERAKKIKMVTLTVEQKDLNVSDSKDFAKRGDVSTDIDIVLKPSSSVVGIFGNTVKDFYKTYYDKDKVVKRITVKADDISKDALSFDTEKLKEKIIIDVKEDIVTGEVDSIDMKSILRREIIPY
jgi:hypothetical protein